MTSVVSDRTSWKAMGYPTSFEHRPHQNNDTVVIQRLPKTLLRILKLTKCLGKYAWTWKQLQTVDTAGWMAKSHSITRWLASSPCFKSPPSRVGWTSCTMQLILQTSTNNRAMKRPCGTIFSLSFSLFSALSSRSTCSLVSDSEDLVLLKTCDFHESESKCTWQWCHEVPSSNKVTSIGHRY